MTASANTKLRDNLLQDIRRAVLRVDPDAEVILFGSRARGEAHAESDWDLLVLSEQSANLKLRDRYYDLIYDLELNYDEALSTVFFSLGRWRSGASPAPLYDNIRREGIQLMTNEERRLFALHKIDKAREALEEVTLLYEAKHYSTTASRLYYAAFYGASALLAQNGYTSKTHVGIKSLLSEHFVKTEILNRSRGKLFIKLFDLRQLGDYGEVLDVSKEQLDEVLDGGVALVRELMRLCR